MDLSLVIPLLNEEESLPELTDWIVRVMLLNAYSYEIIYVDDGSKDGSWKKIEELIAKNPNIKGIKFRRNYGKSAALNVGFEAAQGKVVITMDADLQDSPDEIPELRKMILQDGYDLVSGWKKKRYDPLTKTIPTKLFNYATRKMSGISLHDFNCGLKAYKADVVKSIEVYGEMHRYIPVIAKWAGFSKIGEKEVQHQERKYGSTKFGLERFINGFLDLLSISFVSKFGKRPMHLFGFLGTIMFLIGFCVAFYLGANKLYMVYLNEPEILITQRPSFYIALTTMVLGTMLFLAGFLGELISRNSPTRNSYLIEKKSGL
ncbi:MAG: glycosyltransferase [Bacteroidetes bacterium]|nr:glycosyltransferase [Bacteroidota bacterium]